MIGANELRDIAPYLAPRFLGAAFCPEEGQIDPLRGTAALLAPGEARRRARRGAGLEVTAIARDGAAFAVTTESGTIRAGRVVDRGRAVVRADRRAGRRARCRSAAWCSR